MDNSNEERELVGKSKHISDLLLKIRQAAQNNSSVLIQGPTGTGKELVARKIHSLSPRNNRKFVPVDCAVLSENLLESELFGHVRGAFTGAIANKTGLFEEAEGGTLFLDEVANISLGIQAKLLRFLEEREFTPVGGTRSKKLNIRLIAASNKDLRAQIKKDLFREDLFYRISDFNIYTKPLVARVEDIVYLVNHLIRKNGLKVDPKVKLLLYSYNFPGNVRELEKLINKDYRYIEEEFLRQTACEAEIDYKEILDIKGCSRSKFLFSKDFHVDALLFASEVRKGYSKKIIEAYEITILKLYTEMSNDEIAKHLHIERSKISENGFKKKYGIDLNEFKRYFGDGEFISLYPTFLSRYYLCLKRKDSPRLSYPAQSQDISDE